MTQGLPASDFGVTAPILDSSSCHSGSPLSIDSDGNAILGAKASGSPLVFGLAEFPRTEGEIVPIRFLGPLTLSIEQWNNVALTAGNTPATDGLTPGAVYQQWSGGKINTGGGFMSVGDIIWDVGVALSPTTLLILPRAPATAN